ncbi:MAG: hypothetical protein PF692_08945 [Kiritimatiellae bacterium]|jgi:hypothetical protein|nr:hypothetical protein [Kiritimatiellia bacterium]
MSKVRTIGKWTFRLFPTIMAVLFIVCVFMSFSSEPDKLGSYRFVSENANFFMSHSSLEELRDLSDKGEYVWIQEFDNGEWVAIRMEHSCCSGAGFDATVIFDSNHNIKYDREYTFCGYEALSGMLNEINAEGLSEFYAKLDFLHLKNR